MGECRCRFLLRVNRLRVIQVVVVAPSLVLGPTVGRDGLLPLVKTLLQASIFESEVFQGRIRAEEQLPDGRC